MHLGIITKLVNDGEYGKIKTSRGIEAHFHKNCLWGTAFIDLTEGQDVEFEMQPAYKGNLAFNIRLYTKKEKIYNFVDKAEDDPFSLYCCND